MYSAANQILFDEHQVILQARKQVLKILKAEDLGKWANALNWYVSFFKTYGDLFHHQKEEDSLFKVVANKNPMLAESIVAALTEHHLEFREKLGELHHLIEHEKWTDVKRLFTLYLSDLRDHIEAEDDNFFKVADEALSEKQLDELHAEFVEKDKLLGLERKQALVAQIEENRWK